MPAPTLVLSSSPSSSTSALPVLIFMENGEERTLPISRTPFTIGRKTDRDLIISDPRVSREHAQLVLDGNDFYLVDLGSKHGTFVNGERIDRCKLKRNDRLDFGALDAGYAIFSPERP